MTFLLFLGCYLRNLRKLIASWRKQLQNNFTQMLVSLLFIAKVWILPRNRYISCWHFGVRRMKLKRHRSALRAYPWKVHLLFEHYSPSLEKGWAGHNSCYGSHGTQGTCLSLWLLTFPFTLVFLFYLAEKLIGGQRPWPHNILLCVEARVKVMHFSFLYKLWKPTLSNFAVCSMKSYTGSALILSTNTVKAPYILFY